MTKISEVVEYVLLVHNDDVAKPRALNTLIPRWTGRAGLDKRLIKNKKNSERIARKGKEYGHNEDSKNSTNEGRSTDNIEKEETASDSSQSQESENSDLEAEGEKEAENSDSESTPFLQENNLNACQHCEGLNVNHTAVIECPIAFGMITIKFVLYAVTVFL